MDTCDFLVPPFKTPLISQRVAWTRPLANASSRQRQRWARTQEADSPSTRVRFLHQPVKEGRPGLPLCPGDATLPSLCTLRSAPLRLRLRLTVLIGSSSVGEFVHLLPVWIS